MKSHGLGRNDTSLSRSIELSNPFGKGVGDCASGVETAPKLDMERGESSTERLRLRAMMMSLVLQMQVDVEAVCAADGQCR